MSQMTPSTRIYGVALLLAAACACSAEQESGASDDSGRVSNDVTSGDGKPDAGAAPSAGEVLDYTGKTTQIDYETVGLFFDRARSYSTILAVTDTNVSVHALSFPTPDRAGRKVDVAVASGVPLSGGFIINSTKVKAGPVKTDGVVRLSVLTGAGVALSDVNRQDTNRKIASFTKVSLLPEAVEYEAVLPNGYRQTGTIKIAAGEALRIVAIPKWTSKADPDGLVGTYGYELSFACGGASCVPN